MKQDIFGLIPEIGDTIVFNPAKYKGLVSGECVGFSQSGLPKISMEDKHVYMGQMSKDGCYTPKTGFVIIKKHK